MKKAAPIVINAVYAAVLMAIGALLALWGYTGRPFYGWAALACLVAPFVVAVFAIGVYAIASTIMKSLQ